MANFDFVTDEELRASLEADAKEMAACLQAEAHKAAVVLAGSIVEAVLTDHLDSIGYKDPSGRPLLELDLGQLIAAARSAKQLSAKSADLASAVKTFRNFIHPGRLIRLQERIDADTAAIAGHLVDIVASEVANLKRDTYGYTAQQIITKIESDSSSTAILGDLLKKTGDRELERLLTKDLPARYIELARVEEADEAYFEEHYGGTLLRLRRAYRAAFEAASDDIKARVMKNFARILREESGFEVITHEQAFFRAEDLAYMTDDDRAMAKAHLVDQAGHSLLEDLADALTGIGRYADPKDLFTLVGHYVRYASQRNSPANRRTAARLLQRLHQETPAQHRKVITDHLAARERAPQGRTPDFAAWLAEQRTALISFEDLPF